MDEAKLCDRIALMQNGQFMQVDTPDNIIAKYTETLWAVQGENMSKLLKELKKNPLVKSAYSFGESIHVTFNGELKMESGKWKMNDNHLDLSTPNVQIEKIESTIEDCFMLLTKEKNKNE